MEQETAQQAGRDRGHAKSREGVVVSDAMDKTVVVAVTRLVRDPKYGKFVSRTKKYMAHDQDNTCKTGDRVQIVETRPLSKQKRWMVREVIARAE